MFAKKKKRERKNRMGCRVDQSSFWDLSRQVLVLSSFRHCLRLFNPWHREMQQNLHARLLFRINTLEEAVHLYLRFALYLHCGALLIACLVDACGCFSCGVPESKKGRSTSHDCLLYSIHV